MPSLIRRNNGIYYVVLTRRSRRIWQSLHTRDPLVARREFDERIIQGRTKGYKLSDFWQELRRFLESSAASTTILIYNQVVKNLIQIVGDKSLKNYGAIDFERYKVERTDSVKATTANKELRTIRSLFSNAVRLEIIDRNPALRCKLLRIDQMIPTSFTENQYGLLLKEAKEPIFRTIVVFATATTMRLGEIVHLEWQDLDFNRREIIVKRKAGHRIKGGRDRVEPMSDLAYTILRAIPRTGDSVFVRSNGKRFTVKYISDRFRKLRIKAGLPSGLSFHCLRHTGITWLHLLNVPSESIRQLAGHRSIQTTHLYTHSPFQHLHDASNTLGTKIEGLLNGINVCSLKNYQEDT